MPLGKPNNWKCAITIVSKSNCHSCQHVYSLPRLTRAAHSQATPSSKTSGSSSPQQSTRHDDVEDDWLQRSQPTWMKDANSTSKTLASDATTSKGHDTQKITVGASKQQLNDVRPQPALSGSLKALDSSQVENDLSARIDVNEPTSSSQGIPYHRKLEESRVPSSRIARLFHYGGLATSLTYGAASEAFRRMRVESEQGSTNGETSNSGSLMLSSANITRLVSKLTQMRGAALKLGQFLSIQDTHVLPKDMEDVFRRVQDSAHYMPNWQMERVMISSLGPSWRSTFANFDPIPFAAASLGQVHSAILNGTSSPTGRDEAVAVKVQFPNIAESVESDLSYLRVLLMASAVLPKGLFLDRTLQVMKEELADECNYRREADFIRSFRQNIAQDDRFRVPWVWDGSTESVLVMERMHGVSVGGNVAEGLSQEDRNEIASRILGLCMMELFDFRAMQTDPNWSNFLWNEQTRQIELIDFGATRSYSKIFIDEWLRLLTAAVNEDKEACITHSRQLGYLTGEEDEDMIDAHVRSLTLLATPFRAPGSYTFGRGTEWAQITNDIRSLIPVMLQKRLTPPPRETYSLNRKLSGAFLLASRLNAVVDCRSIWEAVVGRYKFDA